MDNTDTPVTVTAVRENRLSELTPEEFAQRNAELDVLVRQLMPHRFSEER